MNCPICKKECKGKIGVGVHIKKGHTIEERQKYYLDLTLSILPTIVTIVSFFGALAHLDEYRQKALKR